MGPGGFFRSAPVRGKRRRAGHAPAGQREVSPYCISHVIRRCMTGRTRASKYGRWPIASAMPAASSSRHGVFLHSQIIHFTPLNRRRSGWVAGSLLRFLRRWPSLDRHLSPSGRNSFCSRHAQGPLTDGCSFTARRPSRSWGFALSHLRWTIGIGWRSASDALLATCVTPSLTMCSPTLKGRPAMITAIVSQIFECPRASEEAALINSVLRDPVEPKRWMVRQRFPQPSPYPGKPLWAASLAPSHRRHKTSLGVAS
jgi:hypothetical protein